MSPDSMTTGWYYAKAGAPAGHETGPLSWEELYLLARAGTLAPADIVWNPKLPRGVTAGLVPGLFPLSEVPQAAPQPAAPLPTVTQPVAIQTVAAVTVAPVPPQRVVLIQPVVPRPMATAPEPVEPMWDVTPAAVQTPARMTSAAAQTETEVQDLFAEKLGEADVQAAPPKEPKPPKPDRQSRSLPWLIVLLVLVVAAAGLAAYFLYFRDTGGGVQTEPTISPATTVSSFTAATTPGSATPALWTELVTSATTPPARSYHAMAYDPATDRTVLFGGSSGTTKFGDTWALDLASSTWTKLATAGAGPSARDYSQMVYDPVGGGLILFGGSAASGDRNDLWAFDAESNAWAALKPSGTLPQAREGHGMVYDPNTKRVLVFGGLNSESGTLLNDLWAYDPATNAWAKLSPSGTTPPARETPTMAYCTATQRVLVFGGLALGADAQSELGDMWAYDPVAEVWERISPAGTAPSARQGHAAADAPALGGLFMFGGRSGDANLNESWLFSPPAGTWAHLQPAGNAPGAREGHALAYSDAAGTVILFGGYGSAAGLELGDTWVFGPPAGESAL